MIESWAIVATGVAVWATWRVYRLNDRVRYLTAVIEGTK